MNTLNISLVVYVCVITVDVAVLLLDWWLLWSGIDTITARVKERPLLGLPLLLWQVLGAVALGWHFYGR